MKNIIFFVVSCLVFVNVDFCYGSSSCFPDRDKVCKENTKQMSQEYDNFLAFFYGERNWKVSVNFSTVPTKPIKRDGSNRDPFSDKFYE